MSKITIDVYRLLNSKLSVYGRYYGRVKHGTEVDVKTLCRHVAQDSGLEEALVIVVFNAVLKQIAEQVCNGHPIKVEGLGIIKAGVKSKSLSVADVKKRVPTFDPEKEDITKYLSARLVKGAHLLFTPSSEIKALLKSVKFETDKTVWED